ncbi:hypothetical protein QFC19_001546 [Naganishia cerealis]|uniref:Uncharacterized protein n=1 Tax=Naganishia cerealis TaxID=610337 RepID=A0ACC2WG72_9TREE|nr:hypothetical protein QFC19_001546 [Naganishia cerealis]
MAYSTYFTVEEGQYEGTRMWESKCGGNGGKGSDKSDPDGNVVVYTSDIAQRFFCAQCGSPLLMRYFCTPTTLHIPLGLLDVPASGPSAQVREAYKPRQDIWVKSRAWWLPRPKEGEAEGREQYEEDDPDFMERCDRWKRRSSAEHRT